MPPSVSRRSIASSPRTAPSSRRARRRSSSNKIDLRAEPPSFERRGRTHRAGVPRLVRDGRRHRRAPAVRCSSSARRRQSRGASQDGLVDFLVYRPRVSGRRFRILPHRSEASGSPVRCRRTRRSSQPRSTAAGARRGDEVEVDGEILESSDRDCSAARSTRRTTGTSRWPRAARQHFDLDELAVPRRRAARAQGGPARRRVAR